jgi:uncharacterized protein (DUF1501 family)
MTTLPPPTPEPGPEPEPEPVRAISRRGLLIGAAGSLVMVAGGISVVATAHSRPGPEGAAPTTSAGSPATITTATPTSSAVPPASSTPPTAVVGDRILVVLQLGGGNDALNTLVPLTGTYHDARPSLSLADDTLLALPFTSDYGLHPALSPLHPLLQAGQLGVVAGIGFAEPDRSHFKALDMWWSAAPGETFRTGWLGRWLDVESAAQDQMRSIALGGSVPALLADVARSIGVNEIAQFALRDTSSAPALIEAWASLSNDHSVALEATELFAGLTRSADLDGDRPATERLLAAAELIAADPDVRVIHVAISGFDTHSNQLVAHDGLLTDVAEGIARFQAAIEASGHADRVLLITTSEFGRRVAENGSGGTDHGRAGVQFVIGRGVTAPSVFGTIDPSDLVEGDLRPLVDPRSLYATALDWLSGTHGSPVTDTVLGASFARLPFLAGTQPVSATPTSTA